jgi:REP element-mobilizing transposase RayT
MAKPGTHPIQTVRFDPSRHHRRSTRLKGHDYTSDGVYFVTLCARVRVASPFGRQVGDSVLLSDAGRLVTEAWTWLGDSHGYVTLDASILMPDHLHGLIELGGPWPRKPLGNLIAAFKTVSTNAVNRMRGTPGVQLWQRGFYDHIVRHDIALDRIRRYIVNNPIHHQSS